MMGAQAQTLPRPGAVGRTREVTARVVGPPSEVALEAFARLLLARQSASLSLVVVNGKKTG